MRKNIHPKSYKSSIKLADGSIFHSMQYINKKYLITDLDKSAHPIWNPKLQISNRAGQVSKFQDRYNFKI